jgi:long-chain acyl-CoA synthetase
MSRAAEDLLPQCFYRLVEARPDDVFLTQPFGGGQTRDYTFAEVLDQGRRMATHLRSLGLTPGSRIAIASKNCAHFFMCELAIWMSGHVSVALYPTLTGDIVRFILEHSGARLLFVGKLDSWDEIERGVPAELPRIAFPLAPPTAAPGWDEITGATEPIRDAPQRNAADEALILYTSGSTGQPKGVLHSFQTISAPTRGLIATLRLGPLDRYLSYLPLAHTMERWLGECVPLCCGSRVFFAESLDTFLEDLKRARPTVFASVPRLWLKFQLGVFAKLPRKKLERLLGIPVLSGLVKRRILKGLGLDAVRFAGSGSAPIPPELLRWYRDLGLELLEGYGMSENFNYSHLTLPGRGRIGYVGEPHPGVECRLGADGEIQVRSPGTMLGYYRRPDLTAEVLGSDGWLRTGDRGEIDEAGRLRITGRVKELFKTSKGKYVAPVPIENLINASDCVELSCVAGAGRPAPHAVVQLPEPFAGRRDDPAVRERVTADLSRLLEQVNGSVPVYERIAFLAVVSEPWTIEGGHLTPTMKIRRGFLESLYEPHLSAWYSSGHPVIWE